MDNLWIPAYVADNQLLAWWHAPDLDLDDGDAMTEWEDANGAHLTLEGTATFQTAVQNGLPAVEFNGTTDYLALDDLGHFGQPVFVFAVWKMADEASQTLCASEATGTTVGINASSNFEVHGGTSLAGSITKAAWRITSALLNTSASHRGIDGTVTTGDAGAEGFADFVVGASQTTTPANYLDGQIITLLVLSDTPSTADRQSLEGWAAWLCGLQGSLASTHPYKTRRPTI